MNGNLLGTGAMGSMERGCSSFSERVDLFYTSDNILSVSDKILYLAIDWNWTFRFAQNNRGKAKFFQCHSSPKAYLSFSVDLQHLMLELDGSGSVSHLKI